MKTPGMNAGVPQDFNVQWFRKEKTPKGLIAFGRSYFFNGPKSFGKVDWFYKVLLRFGAGLNPTVLLALILISSPVCGFRPVLAFRERTVKVPNPG